MRVVSKSGIPARTMFLTGLRLRSWWILPARPASRQAWRRPGYDRHRRPEGGPPTFAGTGETAPPTARARGRRDLASGAPGGYTSVSVSCGTAVRGFFPVVDGAPQCEERRTRRRALPRGKEDIVAESVYKIIELVGTSTESWEKAAAAAVHRASKTLRDLRIAEVVQLDLHIENGKVASYRAKVRVSFKYEGE